MRWAGSQHASKRNGGGLRERGSRGVGPVSAARPGYWGVRDWNGR